MKRNILFVTSQDGGGNDGLPYVIDLAKITRKGIAVLMLYKSKLSEKFDNFMTAITFAESNEHKIALELLNNSTFEGSTGKKLQEIQEKCIESGIEPHIYTTSKDIPSALQGLLEKDRSFDMILFSPNIKGDGKLCVRDMKKLLRMVSMPIVTLTFQEKPQHSESMEVA